MAYARVLRFVSEHPWAILETRLLAICDWLELRAAGETLSEDERLARIGSAAKPSARRAGAIQVLPVYGVLSHRANLLAAISGGTSTELLAGAIRQAREDPQIGAIVLDVDSPGGSVFGVQELADEVFATRGVKPVVAVANSMAASAAYWIASQADEVVLTPSGEVGSIGVLTVYDEVTGAAEKAGVKRTFIAAGKYKAEASGFEPLTTEARDAIQARVDDYYQAFVRAVARGRGVTQTAVQDGYGEGRMVGARDALRMGMVDRVDTLETVLAGLVGRTATVAPKAEAPAPVEVDDLDRRRRRARLAGRAA